MNPLPLSIAQSFVACYGNITDGKFDVSQTFTDAYRIGNMIVKRRISRAPAITANVMHIEFRICE